MKRKVVVGLLVISVCMLLTGCHIKHEWQEATCTEPKTCTVGGETKGDALGHTWVEATCTKPKTCNVCGETEGEALGHNWQEATCITPKTCSVCRETEGEALGHDWIEATCTTPKTCSVCKETESEALGHNWIEATCIAPKICSMCRETEGEIGDHVWVEATCQTPKTCSVCGVLEGEVIPHNYDENGICTICGESRVVELTIDNVEDFLVISYEVTPNWQFGSPSDGYDWITVTIAPKSSEYIFQNVQIEYTTYYYSFNRDEYTYGDYIPHNPRVNLDNEGYGVDELRFTRKVYGGPTLVMNRLENVVFTDASGYCIKK